MEIKGDWTTKLRRPVAVNLDVFFNPKVLYFIRLGRKSSLGGASNPFFDCQIQAWILLLERLTTCHGIDGWWSWPDARTTSEVLYFAGATLPHVVFRRGNIELQGSYILRWKLGAAIQKDFGTPGLGKMSTFFQKWSGTNLWDY